MVNLTFGEQVKLVLGRKGMTIKELAEQIEKRTGKKMSRQNMTQRLGRDNFQEQDMRMIAEILGCSFELSIMTQIEDVEGVQQELKFEEPEPSELPETEHELTVGEFVQMNEELQAETEAVEAEKAEEKKSAMSGIRGYIRKPIFKRSVSEKKEESEQKESGILGEVNPYTGKEYQTNSVRMHPKRIGYVQVYNQEKHKWTDMTEWAFLGYQERKKALLGKDYDPPIYLD